MKTVFGLLILLLALPVRAADPPATTSAPAIPPAIQRAADEWVTQRRAENPGHAQSVLTPVASENLHLGARQVLPMPLPTLQVYAFRDRTRPELDEPHRSYLAVFADGQITHPLTAASLADWLKAIDRSAWKKARIVPRGAFAGPSPDPHQRGRVAILEKPADFMAITFAMPKEGPAADARAKAAEGVKAPKVATAAGTTTVTFTAWHVIGGPLITWEVRFPKDGPPVVAQTQHGRFGGGGYD